jgi:hypothetical protein
MSASSQHYLVHFFEEQQVDALMRTNECGGGVAIDEYKTLDSIKFLHARQRDICELSYEMTT